MLTGGIHFLLSVDLLAEYTTVLLRPRIRVRHGLDDGEVERLLVEIATRGAVREPVPGRAREPDAGDRHLFDLLGTEAAAVPVTGDRRLLASRSGRRRVVPPRDFLERLAVE